MSQFSGEFEHLSSAERLELVDQIWDSLGEDKSIDAVARNNRIKLAQDIWDSIPDDQTCVLTPELKAELDRRLADFEVNPHNCMIWDEVKAKIQREL